MKTSELISRLVKKGVSLQVKEGELKVKAPKGVLDPETAGKIKEKKGEIISILQDLGAQRVRIPQSEIRDFYPLSSSQKRLFFLNQLKPDTLAYNIFQVLEVKGEFHYDRVKAAFQALVDRHSSLRTAIFMKDGEPVQKIIPKIELEIPIYSLAYGQNPQEIIDEVIRPYDLGSAPLFRVAVIKVNDGQHQLIIDMHHIIADGASLPILMAEFIQKYRGGSLDPLSIEYKDFAVWQQTEDYLKIEEKQKVFWINQFQDLPDPLELPTDHARPVQKTFKGDAVTFHIKGDDLDQLQQVMDRFQTTKFVTLFAVFNVFLHKLTGQEDIVIGTFTSGRDREELESLIGMFVNTLPLRNSPRANMSFAEFLTEMKPDVIDCFDNQWFQFEKLVETLAIPKDQSRNPLFDVIFSYNASDEKSTTLDGLEITQAHFEYENVKFDLKLSIQDYPNELICKFEYATDLFEKRSIEQFVEAFEMVFQQTIHRPDCQIGDVQIITGESREKLLTQSKGESVVFDHESILTLFKDNVNVQPDSVAVDCGKDQLTYRQLEEQSDQLARYLLSKGAQSGELIGVFLKNSPELVVSVLGVLKAGAAFALIDPANPAKRSATIIQESEVNFLITQGIDRQTKDLFGPHLNYLDLSANDVFVNRALDLPAISGEDLAYVLFTSGSTGVPKGAMISHGAIANYFQWAIPGYLRGKKGDMALFTSVSFDLTLTALFLPIVTGNCLHIPEGSIHASSVIDVIESNKVDVIKLTPSHLRLLLNAGVMTPNLKAHTLVVAGEVLDADLANEVSQATDHEVVIFNSYGPTEAAVSCMLSRYDQNRHLEKVPIGSPAPNNEVWLLDEMKNLVPQGVPGEIHIGGGQLFNGYLNNETQTRDKLIDHPFDHGKKLYKTGDLAIRRADGSLEFRGRIDEQVKIRGYRIELAEIEHCLRHHDLIKEAAAVVNEQQQIAVYYELKSALDAEALKFYLLERLPNYMVPALYQPLDQLPLTDNGKIDRRALPEIKRKTVDHQEASGEVQEKLVNIWSDLLDLEPDSISINASFFDLGGNSINIIALTQRINKEFGVDIPVASIFSLPTINRIHQHIEQGDDTKTTVDRELTETLAETNETLEILGLTN